jgi:Ca2+-binding RTX toxin-like protein
MPINTAITYLVYTDLQMAAEATLDRFTFTSPQGLKEALEFGNNRSSKFTPTQADQFVQDWKVVSHKPNTSTGFSGTLFECLRDDPARGLVRGQLVMSFRSTEFIDDAARDNQATNSMEIKPFGWAFGQVADMKNWVDSLYASGRITTDRNLTVTGYSLGGHLATAFNMLFPGDADATYTFNGAGVGRMTNNATLTSVVAQFEQMRLASANLSSLFTRADLRLIYQDLRNTVRGGAAPTQAQIDAVRLLAPPPSPVGTPTIDPEWQLLNDALDRVRTIQAEAARVPGLPSGLSSSPPPTNVTAANVQSTDINYQLAVLVSARSTEAVNVLVGGVQAVTTRQPGPYRFDNFYDIYGYTNPSGVANSQVHYGTPTPVFIEDQPLYRGDVFDEVQAQTLQYNDLKLLVPGYANNDFGDTHSLVLIVDSLSVQNALTKLDPNATSATLDAVLRQASNAKKDSVSNSQGKAEFDTLERVVDALGRVFGVTTSSNWTPMTPNPSGGTWATVGNTGAFTGRDVLHRNLQAITTSDPFQALVGQVRVASGHDASAARNDFLALQSLISGSTFSLRLVDPSSMSPALGAANSQVYEQWLSDRNIVSNRGDRNALNFTDEYLQDRTIFLNALARRNTSNITDPLIGDTRVSSDRLYDFQYQDQFKNESASLSVMNALAPPGVPSNRPRQLIVFGNDEGTVIQGTDETRFGDHLYGGGGNDTVKGDKGADWLEGNLGNDRIEGGADNDTLWGGAGADTLEGGTGSDFLKGGAGRDVYAFTGPWGVDTIDDSDGDGVLQVEGFASFDGAGAKRIAADANVWQTDDRRVTYVVVPVDATHQHLEITVRYDSNGDGQTDATYGMTVRNWSDGQLGIRLGSEVAAPPPDQHVFNGDFIKTIDLGQYSRDVRGNYISAGAQADAQDVIRGSSGADSLYGGGGNDGLEGDDGEDLIDGGAGDDVLFGGWANPSDRRVLHETLRDPALVAAVPSLAGQVSVAGSAGNACNDDQLRLAA